MHSNIYNTISKTLSRGLIGFALIAMLLGGFVVGGGIEVEAAGINGWKITSREVGGGLAIYCGDDRGSSEVADYIDLSGSTAALDKIKEPKTQNVKFCVYASRGNNGGETNDLGMFENCTILRNQGSIDLFCTSATRLSKDPRIGKILKKSELKDLGYIATGSAMTVSHKWFSRSDCIDDTNNPAGTSKKGDVKCKIKGGEKVGGYDCWAYYANVEPDLEKNQVVICDNSDTDKTEDGKSFGNLLDKNESGVYCSVTLIKPKDGTAGYLPGSIIGCQKGKLGDGASAVDDGVSKKNCIAVRNVDVGNNLNGDLFCRKENEKIYFSDLPSGYDYIYSSFKNISMFKAPDGRVLTVDEKTMVKVCENQNVIELSEIATETQSAVRSGKLDCKKKTKAQFFALIDTELKNGNTGVSAGEANTGAASADLKPGDASNPKSNSNLAGDFFTIIYKIVAVIIFAILFVIRYLQMFILLAFISVMTVLLNLSPNSGFLTTLAVPLWAIFAQIANLGAVFVLIYLGAATMIGLPEMDYKKAIEKGTQVALYTFVSSFTYFGLAFIISMLDGFTKLIVLVFGGGSVFKLFEALIASVSSISALSGNRNGYALIPDFEGIKKGAGDIFGANGAGDVTTKLVIEIIVVVGLGFIIYTFGKIFFMLLTRVAILLLLLITSPLWVLGYLVKDSLPDELKKNMDQAVKLLGGTILFNFAFIITLVLVTIITQKINDGATDFIKNNIQAFAPQVNTGLAFIDPVGANAQAATTTISDDSFSSFGQGFLGTVSVLSILSINLVIIWKAFEFVETLIDSSIVSAGKIVGEKVGTAMSQFGKAGSLKAAVGGAFGAAGSAITGGGEVTKKVLGGATGAVGMLGVQQSVNGILRNRANKSIETNTDKNRDLQEKYDKAKASGNEKEMKKIKLDMNRNQAAIDYAKETVKSTRGEGRKNITDRLTDLGKGNIGADYIKSKTDQSDHQEIEREAKDVRYNLIRDEKKKNDDYINEYYKNNENSDYLPQYLIGTDGKLDQRFVQKDSNGENTATYAKNIAPNPLSSDSIDKKQIKTDQEARDTNLESLKSIKNSLENINKINDRQIERKQELKEKYNAAKPQIISAMKDYHTASKDIKLKIESFDIKLGELNDPNTGAINGDPTSVLFDSTTKAREIARLQTEKINLQNQRNRLLSDLKANVSSQREQRSQYTPEKDPVYKSLETRVTENEEEIFKSKRANGYRGEAPQGPLPRN